MVSECARLYRDQRCKRFFSGEKPDAIPRQNAWEQATSRARATPHRISRLSVFATATRPFCTRACCVTSDFSPICALTRGLIPHDTISWCRSQVEPACFVMSQRRHAPPVQRRPRAASRTVPEPGGVARTDFIEDRLGGEGTGRVGLHGIAGGGDLLAQPALHGPVTFPQSPQACPHHPRFPRQKRGRPPVRR
jgi:hypothetical protein